MLLLLYFKFLLYLTILSEELTAVGCFGVLTFESVFSNLISRLIVTFKFMKRLLDLGFLKVLGENGSTESRFFAVRQNLFFSHSLVRNCIFNLSFVLEFTPKSMIPWWYKHFTRKHHPSSDFLVNNIVSCTMQDTQRLFSVKYLFGEANITLHFLLLKDN